MRDLAVLVNQELTRREGLSAKHPERLEKVVADRVYHAILDLGRVGEDTFLFYESNPGLVPLLIADELQASTLRQDSLLFIMHPDYDLVGAVKRNGGVRGILYRAIMKDDALRKRWQLGQRRGGPAFEGVDTDKTMIYIPCLSHLGVAQNYGDSLLHVSGKLGQGENVVIFLADSPIFDEGRNMQKRAAARPIVKLESDMAIGTVRWRNAGWRWITGSRWTSHYLLPSQDEVEAKIKFPRKDRNYLLLPITKGMDVIALHGSIRGYIGTYMSQDPMQDIYFSPEFDFGFLERFFGRQPIKGRIFPWNLQRLHVNGTGFAIVEAPDGKRTSVLTPNDPDRVNGKIIAMTENADIYVDGLGFTALSMFLGIPLGMGLVYGAQAFGMPLIPYLVMGGLVGAYAGLGLDQHSARRYVSALAGAGFGAGAGALAYAIDSPYALIPALAIGGMFGHMGARIAASMVVNPREIREWYSQLFTALYLTDDNAILQPMIVSERRAYYIEA